MNKLLLCILLITSGCVTAEPDRPHSPELILTMEDHLDWLHGQKINFKPLTKRILVSRLVKKYFHTGRLNRDNIALEIGRQLSTLEKQFLSETLSIESNKDILVLDKTKEFVIVGSYTIKRKNWWDRIGASTIRMLIVENADEERFVMLDSLLYSSNKPNLFDFEKLPL